MHLVTLLAPQSRSVAFPPLKLRTPYTVLFATTFATTSSWSSKARRRTWPLSISSRQLPFVYVRAYQNLVRRDNRPCFLAAVQSNDQFLRRGGLNQSPGGNAQTSGSGTNSGANNNLINRVSLYGVQEQYREFVALCLDSSAHVNCRKVRSGELTWLGGLMVVPMNTVRIAVSLDRTPHFHCTKSGSALS
jgi:hypothetical protein